MSLIHLAQESHDGYPASTARDGHGGPLGRVRSGWPATRRSRVTAAPITGGSPLRPIIPFRLRHRRYHLPVSVGHRIIHHTNERLGARATRNPGCRSPGTRGPRHPKTQRRTNARRAADRTGLRAARQRPRPATRRRRVIGSASGGPRPGGEAKRNQITRIRGDGPGQENVGRAQGH